MNDYPTCVECKETFQPFEDHTFCSVACQTIYYDRQEFESDERHQSESRLHPLFRSILGAFGLR